jgi:hypothetical protein
MHWPHPAATEAVESVLPDAEKKLTTPSTTQKASERA